MGHPKSKPEHDPSILRDLPHMLEFDNKVKVGGVDVDGILRGKLMSKNKFLSIAADGFGFCSLVFGWDMHDMTYFKELTVSNKANGYRDLIAVPDLGSFRRIPWEDNVPFFLLTFFDPETMWPVSACPRGLLRSVAATWEAHGFTAMAGGKHCFY
jgi:glutamine synthetase